MLKSICILLFTCFILPLNIVAQDDPPIEEEEEDSVVDYSNLVQTTENKAYASSRIVGQLPIKLFSLGYDIQGAHSLSVEPFGDTGVPTDNEINSA